ncbi:hypothetical protein ACFW16_26040 [Inquilinus sp. NPDC058860]|uniref:hypothetical protein n=1 Tax=Inquilinus sp. NPDC058860 TaxID=3346652 RepID=UPI00368B7F6B
MHGRDPPNCRIAGPGPCGGELMIMAESACRHGLRRVAETPIRVGGRCLRAAIIVIAAASLVDGAQAQLQIDPPPPLPSPARPPGKPVPAYPLVKPGLPAPGPGIGQPAQPAPGEHSAPASVRVRQSKTHPNGMTISVDTVSFLPSSIVVDVEIFNPGIDRRRLNPSGSLLLTDDRGRNYPFLPPPDNPEMQIAPRSHVFGRLVFLGGVNWQARSLRLTINHPLGSPADRMTATPLFQFSLPAEPRS